MNRKDKEKVVKTPNGFLYLLVYILIFPVLKIFFRLKTDKSSYVKPKGPILVLSNHQSYMDFLHVMLSLYPKRLNTIVGQKYFYIKPLSWLLPLMGCIPKSMFEPDARSIMSILAVIKRGGSVLIFPEGRISADGTYFGIHKATGKLIKKLGVPVTTCKIEGAYICMPYWRKGIRSGNIRVTFENLISADETKSLSIDEINFRIDKKMLEANTDPASKKFKVNSNKKLAEKLEQILYFCPCCETEFKLKSNGNDFWCTNCGARASMDRYANLQSADNSNLPISIQQWCRVQHKHDMSSLTEDMKPIIIPVILNVSSPKTGGLEASGKGSIELNPKGWVYNGDLNGEKITRLFPIDTVPGIPFEPYLDFQIYGYGKHHAFTPYENLEACTKISNIGECAYQKFASEVMIKKY